MNWIQKLRYKKISHVATAEDLLKEFCRKIIHISSVLVPVFASRWYMHTVVFLCAVSVLYCISEMLRLKGYKLFFISTLTFIAARKRDEGRFVLGPITLASGVIISLLLFPKDIYYTAIWVTALGDGFASLIGKLYGQMHLIISKDKTIVGSTACFIASFIAAAAAQALPLNSCFIIACAATIIEMLPLKDLDNVLIPIAIGGLTIALQGTVKLL